MNFIKKKNVFVTGMGVVSAIGDNTKDFGFSLKNGISGIRKKDALKGSLYKNLIVADINKFSFEETSRERVFLPKGVIDKAYKCVRRSPFTIQTSVSAALEAWEKAGLYKDVIDPERVGIVVAGHNLSQRYQYDTYLKYGQKLDYLNPRYALHYMDSNHIGTLSEVFNIKGEGITVGGASATGNVGIIKGYQLIQSGIVDICMVLAPPAELSPIEIQGFYNIGAMGGRGFDADPKKVCRPFDKEHEGFIYGQGAGCLILESFESVQRKRKKVLAEILGTGIVLDANRLSDPNEIGESSAIMKALDTAGIKPSDIDYINAHGSSSPVGDKVELKAIKKVFGKNLDTIWINSTKGLTGHCLYSAGVIEAIATIIQMKENFVHPNVNLDNSIDDDFCFVKAKYQNADIEYAINNSFGFGGINTCVVLKNNGAN